MFTKSMVLLGLAIVLGAAVPAYADSYNCITNSKVYGDGNTVINNCTIVKSNSEEDVADEDRRPVRQSRPTSDYGYVTDYAPTYTPSYGPAYYGPAYAPAYAPPYRRAYAYVGYGPGVYNAGPRMMMGGRFGFRR